MHSTFAEGDLSFSQYIQKMQERIRSLRLDITDTNAQTIIAANSPKVFIPNTNPGKNGILFIHGLLDSPHIFETMFQEFAQRGFEARSILLPGHGTVPGDLLEVDVAAWQQAVAYGERCFGDDIENLYIAGYSTGGSLAIYQAHFSSRVKGLLLFAPAIQIRHPLAAVTKYHLHFGAVWERARWFVVGEDNDYAKYQSIALNGVYQVYRLSQQIAQLQQQSPLSIPLFMVTSDDDEAINSNAAKSYFLQTKHPLSQLHIYSNEHEAISDERVQIHPSAIPEEKILNFSHICLAIGGEHPHYGPQGDFSDFQHYKMWPGTWLYDETNELRRGAVSFANMRDFHLQRLTYNPDFKNMMSRIFSFIEHTKGKRDSVVIPEAQTVIQQQPPLAQG